MKPSAKSLRRIDPDWTQGWRGQPAWLRRLVGALAALLLSAAAPLIACNQCTGWNQESNSTADLTESESKTLAREAADSGFDEAGQPGFQNQQVTGIFTNLASTLDDAGDCLTVDDEMNNLTISMNCPPDAGVFDLSDLRASACDDATCTWLSGTLDVEAYRPECPGQECGLLMADLVLPVVLDGGGPFVSGSASLLYDEVPVHYSCGLDLAGGD